MPRVPLLARIVLMSLGLLPGTCLGQQGFPYGTSVPARPVVTNVPMTGPSWGNQASPPRGPKTIVFSSPAVASQSPKPLVAGTFQAKQFVATSNSPQMSGSTAPKELVPTENRVPEQQVAQLAPVERPSRVTNPMLQNMSNPSNLSFEGLATAQQFAPNTYFGRQFNDWGNLRDTAMAPASFGGLSPTPPQPFGIYFEPNTYVGTGYSNWSNMSSGVVSLNPLGGWNYSTR